VIAEQHLALTETFDSPWFFPGKKSESEFVGEVLLRCNARDIIKQSGELAQHLSRKATDSDSAVPDIKISGHLEAEFPYIQSHLEYIVGELLRNSILAVMERNRGSSLAPHPIEVLICEAPQHVIIRISDQGGGIRPDMIPYLWSFNKGPKNAARLRNLEMIPVMAATVNELQGSSLSQSTSENRPLHEMRRDSSLSSLSSRPPNLRLGMGLPMSRVYAEYWAGSLELHSLEGYGVDAFLQISKLGNQNEQINTRASIDAV
jgi:pyruvate dehydrogenase kinase 2/3/4